MNLLALPAVLLAYIAAFPIARAQYPPPASYDNILTSPVNPKVTVSYKQPANGTCTTAFSTQKQYTGYIELPPYTLAPIQQNYSINTFFWFVEARQTPESAPLTIWLNGGPGSSSMFGMFNEVGPCEVVQKTDGSYGTQMRAFGWDRASNILFIDQPNLVGFSYDVATNLSVDLITGQYDQPLDRPKTDLAASVTLNGTFPSIGPYQTSANTTEIAAVATWHFLQTWLSTFKQYNPATRPNVTTPNSDEPAGVSLFTESYGGKYGPVFASYFEEQNDAIASGTLSSATTLPIRVQSVGIMNGIVDDLIQDYYYPLFAFNNTYGVDIISQTQQLNALNDYNNDCVPAINACRMAAGTDLHGDDDNANRLCRIARTTCSQLTALIGPSQYYPYDIRQKEPTPDPSAAYQEYLNNASVLESIGARVNYTESNQNVFDAFVSTGDTVRGGMIQDLADLLKRGVRVALVYGDADYLCNWMGGQAVAFAIADALSNSTSPASVDASGASQALTYSAGFAKAGYADIVVNDTYVGGAVRQYGNLSFSRIYDAGHFIPYYQPETAFQVFARVLFGKDLSFGQEVDLQTFASNGTANSTYVNKIPDPPKPTCWLRSWNSSCGQDDMEAMSNGQGVVEFGIFYQDADDVVRPSKTVEAGIPGSPMNTPSFSSGTKVDQGTSSSSVALTGFYTATGTPKPKKGAAAKMELSLGCGITGLALVIVGMML
ncbi:unnamed protein product [Zymoseptoria tritici ST99CH_3D1]|nr:unnamed protein product [Zymoseptoria tritici ST99CH_3D1]